MRKEKYVAIKWDLKKKKKNRNKRGTQCGTTSRSMVIMVERFSVKPRVLVLKGGGGLPRKPLSINVQSALLKKFIRNSKLIL